MNNNDQNGSDDGGISGIRSESLSDRVFREWQKGRSLREISEELNLPIETVKRLLKERQKTLIQKGTLKL